MRKVLVECVCKGSSAYRCKVCAWSTHRGFVPLNRDEAIERLLDALPDEQFSWYAPEVLKPFCARMISTIVQDDESEVCKHGKIWHEHCEECTR